MGESRRWVGLAVFLGVLAAGAIAVRSLVPPSAPWPGRGPKAWAEMRIPALRVASSPAWDREPSRVAVIRRGDGVEALLSYEPGDGGPRHRLDFRDSIPWPRLHPTPAASSESAYFEMLRFRPALLLIADATEPWEMASAVGDEWFERQPRFYLGGRQADGSLGALPLFVDPRVEDEVTRLGAALSPADFEAPGMVELRITREGPQVRYRFGHHAVEKTGPRRWDGGDVRLPEEGLLAPGDGPLLPALAALLRERFATAGGPRAGVYLEIGEGVRYVDVLRAVECAEGSPEVLFLEVRRLWGREPENIQLPRAPAADAEPLAEDFGHGKRSILNMTRTPSGRGTDLRVKGIPYSLEKLPDLLAEKDTALVRVDKRAPWGEVRQVARAVRARGLSLEFTFDPEEEWFRPERFLAVPAPPEGAPPARVSVRVAPDDSWSFAEDPGDLRGRAVFLEAAADAPTGAVLQAALHLLARGATGIDF